METLGFPKATEFGEGIYQLTEGPKAHTHTYHKYCPWNADGSKFIFFEYEKTREEGNLCLMNFPSGETRIIGTSDRWNAHSVAQQFWLGDQDRIIYHSSEVGGDVEHKIVDLQGKEITFRLPVEVGVSDGELFVGGYTFENVFPNDAIVDRDKLGVVSVDPHTGDVSLLCSIQRVLDNHPQKNEIERMHVFTKQYLLHQRLRKLAFNLANSPYFNCGEDERKVGHLHALDLETDQLTFVGKIGHHPIWHPTEPWLLSFSDDEEGRRRLTLDKLRDDGAVEREFLEYFSTSGHPSFDPTCRYIVEDNYDKRKGYITLDLFDTEEKKTYQLAQCKRTTRGYPSQQMKREEGEAVVAFLARGNWGINKKYIVQAHPAWDRTGRFVAFNSDATGESQVYVVDLAELGYCNG